MNPVLAAIQAALVQIAQSAVVAVLPVIVSWFQKHVLPKDKLLMSLPLGELRAQARTWVNGLLVEIGQALVSKHVVPVWLTPLLPTLEAFLEQAINKALDDAGL